MQVGMQNFKSSQTRVVGTIFDACHISCLAQSHTSPSRSICSTHQQQKSELHIDTNVLLPKLICDALHVSDKIS